MAPMRAGIDAPPTERDAPVMKMVRVTANPAPAERPMRSGAARGFLRSDWRSVPAMPRVEPTMMAVQIRWMRRDWMVESSGNPHCWRLVPAMRRRAAMMASARVRRRRMVMDFRFTGEFMRRFMRRRGAEILGWGRNTLEGV